MTAFTGHCLCGAIRFRGTHDATNDLKACHCSQCRRWSGHYWAAILPSSLEIEGEPRWYRASDFARRGFCPDCGSSLFWQRDGSDIIDVAAGAIDSPTGLRLRVAPVNRKTGRGRHTTTTVTLKPLSFGGFLVDTPGIREFGLHDISAADLDGFYPEIAEAALYLAGDAASFTTGTTLAVDGGWLAG